MLKFYDREPFYNRELEIKRLYIILFVECADLNLILISIQILYRLSSLRVFCRRKRHVMPNTLTFFKLISGSIKRFHFIYQCQFLPFFVTFLQMSNCRHLISWRTRELWNTAVCIPVHRGGDRWSKSPRTRQVVGMSGMSTDTSRQHLPTLAVSHPFALRSHT